MSTLKDIFDTIKDVKADAVDVIPYIGGKSVGSLAKASQTAILNFPVIVSNTISIEDATLISKALEKEFATFVLTFSSMNPYLISDNPQDLNATNYIRKLHQNMDNRLDKSDLIGYATDSARALGESFGYEDIELDDGMRISYKVYEGVSYKNINDENSKYNYTIDDVTTSKKLNDFGKRNISTESDVTNSSPVYVNRENHLRNDNSSSPTNNGVGAHSFKDVKLLLDNDAKKANELVPTLLHLRVFPVFKGGSMTKELTPLEFIIGIKATLHPVDTEEVTTNVARGIKNENIFFNFIRWTTGEIKFFKDFLFSVNELKIDATNDGAKASKWWSMLKRRRSLAKLKNRFSKNKFIPNATIVLTQEEVNLIRDSYGYDLSKTDMAYELMRNYFLMSLVIVDPALQRVKFLFDGRNEFETLTYATLSREATTNDKQFKEMLNMMSRRI